MADEFFKYIFPALLVAIPVFYTTWNGRRQVRLMEARIAAESKKLAAESKVLDADYAGQITDSVMDLLPSYRTEIDRLRAKVNELTMAMSAIGDKVRWYETLLAEQEASCEKKISTYAADVERLTARLARYETEANRQSVVIHDLQGDIARYKNWVSVLVSQMKSAGLTPMIDFNGTD